LANKKEPPFEVAPKIANNNYDYLGCKRVIVTAVLNSSFLAPVSAQNLLSCFKEFRICSLERGPVTLFDGLISLIVVLGEFGNDGNTTHSENCSSPGFGKIDGG
jgi:hypothetical protein